MTSERKRKFAALIAKSEERQRSTLVPLMLQRLSIMSINDIHFNAGFLTGPQKMKQSLEEIFDKTHLPDVICMQKGMDNMEELKNMGYQLVICAGTQGVAQSNDKMIYHNQETLDTCRRDQSHELLVNQVYIAEASPWKVDESGVTQISKTLKLAGGCGRESRWLEVRSMCWVILKKPDSSTPAVCVMNTHLSGGRLEDQYFVQQLEQERYSQVERCIEFFLEKRCHKQSIALGVLVGDFNAPRTYTVDGRMSDYFKSAIRTSQGVWMDARPHNVETEEALQDEFKRYIVSPFKALTDWHWRLPYQEEKDGTTSAFGHPVNYMAVSRKVVTDRPQRVILNNEKVKGKQTDTQKSTTHQAALITSFFV